MKGIAVRTLVMVVGLIIISLLLISLLVAAGDLAVILPELFLGWIPEMKPQLGYSSFGGVEIVDIAGDGQPMTATQVGCALARTVRDDFAVYGESESAARGKTLEPLTDELRLIDAKRFSIGLDRVHYKDFMHYWESKNLNSTQKQNLLEGCDLKDEVTALPNKGNGCPVHLDEACVSLMMSKMEVGERDFCTGDKTLIAGGRPYKFGNNECEYKPLAEIPVWLQISGITEEEIPGESTISPDWRQSCAVCKGGDRIKGWIAGGPDYDKYVKDNEYTVSLYKVKDMQTQFFPPGYETCPVYQYSSGTPQVPYPRYEKIRDEACTPDYMYTVYWSTKGRYYQIEFPRIPKGEYLGKKDVNTLILNELAHPFMYNDFAARKSTAGVLYPELRMVRNITFTPEKDVLINDFVDRFLRDLNSGYMADGVDWTPEYNDCLGEDCYTLFPKWVMYHEAWKKKSPEGGTAGWFIDPITTAITYGIEWASDKILGDANKEVFHEIYNCGKEFKKKNPDYKTIQVHTNLIPNEDYLNSTKSYNIILTYWAKVKYGRQKDTGSEGGCRLGVPGECRYCVKSCTDHTYRWSYNCIGGTGFTHDRTNTVYFDHSLIIVDTERMGAFAGVGP